MQWRLRPVFILAVLVFLLSTPINAQAAGQNGIECGCSLVGAYKDPTTGKEIEINYVDGTSPKGLYQLAYLTSGGQIDLTITRVATREQVLHLSVPGGNTHWGFSPDDHRFVYHYTVSSNPTIHHVFLYDLNADPARLVTQFEMTVHSSTLLFSPHGRYLFYGALTSVSPTWHTALKVIDAGSGSAAYAAEFDSIPVPGDPGDTLPMVDWGFSPDRKDRSFVYAYQTGQNTVQWRLVNLASASLVADEPIPYISAFWQFSPCGEVLGRVSQNGFGQQDVSLLTTSDGKLVSGSKRTMTIGDTTFESTAAQHIATVGGGNYALAGNTAGNACPVDSTLAGISLDPTSITGGWTSTGTVLLNGAAPAGGVTVALSSSDPAAIVPDTVSVPAGATSATFEVQTVLVDTVASATIGAASGGISKQATLRILPPALAELSTEPHSVLGGGSATGSVAINVPAPQTGIAITLQSDHPQAASAPAQVVIPAGEQSVVFLVETSQVTEQHEVLITASRLGKSLQTALTVRPITLRTLELDPPEVVGGIGPQARVTISDPAPAAGTVVTASSDNPALASVEPTIVVLEGGAVGYVSIETYGVAASSDVMISASCGGVTRAAKLTLLPASLDSFDFQLSICSGIDRGSDLPSIVAGYSVTAIVSLDGKAPPDGALINVASSDRAILAPPASVLVPAQASSAEFPLQTDPDGPAGEVTITTSYRGVERSGTLRVVRVPSYNVVPLTGLKSIAAINNKSQVLGTAAADEAMAVWQQGTTTNLGFPPESPSFTVADINTAGQIAGTMRTARGGQAFLWQDGTFADIGPTSKDFSGSVARAINEAGQVAGEMTRTTSERVGFIYDPSSHDPLTGTVTALPIGSGYRDALIYGLNASGRPVGYVQKTVGLSIVAHAALWDPGAATPALFMGSTGNTIAYGINDHGAIIGERGYPYYSTAAFSWKDGTLTYLNPPPGFKQPRPDRINNAGQIIGQMYLVGEGSTDGRPFIDDGHMLYDLNCWLKPGSGWSIVAAIDLNDSGEIIAYAERDASESPVLLTQAEPQSPRSAVYLPLLMR